MNSPTLSVLQLSSEKDWRGGEQQIAYLLDELRNHGVHVHAGVRKGSVVESYCTKKGHVFTPLDFGSSIDVATALKIKSLCRNYKFDLIHAHSSRSHSAAVIAAALGNTTPIILSRRVDFVPKNSWLTRWKYNHPSIKKVLCVSDKINEIMHGYLENPDKSITVHSGVDLTRFNTARGNLLRTELGIDDSVFLVGNTSALEDHKDYPTFLRTIATLRESSIPVHAIIMGKGSMENDLKALTQSLGLSDCVTYTGFRNDLSVILSELDCFLMTSKEEGLGTSVLDAFVAGVPVVATRAGGIPEMVEHEVTGLLELPGDANALAKALIRLIDDSGLRKSIITNAHRKVAFFSKEETARKTLDIYHEVLGT